MAAPLHIVIEDDQGRRQVVGFSGDEITLGRARDGNTVLLVERNVSRHHARFVRANGVVFLEDLGSANGTRVNGERLSGRRRIREGDLIQIGDYDIALEGAEAPARGEDLATGAVPAVAPAAAVPPPLPGTARAAAPAPPSAPAPPLVVAPPAGPRAAARPAAPARREPSPGRRGLVLAAVAVASLLAGWAAGNLTRQPARADAAAERR